MLLTTGQCARIIGSVSTRYIYDEIREGRLRAQVVPRDPLPGRRRGYDSIRVAASDFEAYLRQRWPGVAWKWHEGSTGKQSTESTKSPKVLPAVTHLSHPSS